jgi:hypothetical protein
MSSKSSALTDRRLAARAAAALTALVLLACWPLRGELQLAAGLSVALSFLAAGLAKERDCPPSSSICVSFSSLGRFLLDVT